MAAALGTATVEVAPDTTHLVEALRVIARHAQACADELALLNRKDS